MSVSVCVCVCVYACVHVCMCVCVNVMHVGVGMGICDSGEWMGPRNFWRQLYYLNGSNLTFADKLTYT